MTDGDEGRILRIMQKVRATDFARNFSRYREQAQREPIAITSHDRVTGYFVSKHEFEVYSQHRDRYPAAYYVWELPDYIIDAIENSEMDPRHNHLDALLDEA